MENGVLVAVISAISSIVVGGISLLGVVLTNNKANHKLINESKTTQAVMEQRLDELTREVREHNNFAMKIPVLEQKIKVLEKLVFNGKE